MLDERQIGLFFTLQLLQLLTDWIVYLRCPTDIFNERPPVHKYQGSTDFIQAELTLAAHCDLTIIATCRSGPEFDRTQSDPELRAFLQSFFAVHCSDFSASELIALARRVDKQFTLTSSDRTPGSVLLGLDAMRSRLTSANTDAQAVMRAMF